MTSVPEDFDPEVYIAMHQDLLAEAAGTSDRKKWGIKHYTEHGAQEDREYFSENIVSVTVSNTKCDGFVESFNDVDEVLALTYTGKGASLNQLSRFIEHCFDDTTKTVSLMGVDLDKVFGRLGFSATFIPGVERDLVVTYRKVTASRPVTPRINLAKQDVEDESEAQQEQQQEEELAAPGAKPKNGGFSPHFGFFEVVERRKAADNEDPACAFTEVPKRQNTAEFTSMLVKNFASPLAK